jgi:hypothetical protein
LKARKATDDYRASRLKVFLELIQNKIDKKAANGFDYELFQEEELHFKEVREALIEKGYTIKHDDDNNMYKVSW